MIYFLQLLLSVLAYSQISLEESTELALKNSEVILRAQAQKEAADKRKKQAYGVMGPNLALVGAYTTIQPPPGEGLRAFTRSNQYSSAINLRQPLLRGGSLSALEFAKRDIIFQELNKKSQDLFVKREVITHYFNYLSLQHDLKHLNELKILSTNQTKELNQRVKVGRSRLSEKLQAEAQLENVDAQLSQAQQDLKIFKERFYFIIGAEKTPNDLGNESISQKKYQEYLTEFKNRPDILAKNQEVLLAESRVNIAKGGHYPTLEFSGNYFLTRTGILEQSRWDLGMNLRFPLFEGGVINAQVKEAHDLKRATTLDKDLYERQELRDLQILYYSLEQSLEQTNKLKTANEKANKNYQANLKDYRFGLVTNLDVLQSLNLYIDTKRLYDRARYSAWLNYYLLELNREKIL